MNDLNKYIGKVTKCSDGETRRLRAYDDLYIYYDVPIDSKNGVWMELDATKKRYRYLFLEGEIL